MPDPLDRMVRTTVQSQVRDDKAPSASLILWLAAATEVIPPWWSKRRDVELRKFWRQVDPLSGAVYALESKMATIPFHVEPKDYSIRAHADQAERFEAMLADASEWGKGWGVFFGKWTQDLLTQDNGAFGEILGDGDPSGPIVGMPYGICSLDSNRCDRTSNPEFPVVYTALDGKRYKLHYTRVAYASLQSSPVAEMHDVGFCAISKCVNIAQNVLDMLVYQQEKLGSRPTRSLMVTQGGLDPEDVKAAFTVANEAQDNQMLTRYSKTVVLGSASVPEGKIEMHDLASIPDGFSYETSMMLGMAAIALAFGVDARELWPMTSTGATRADALIQHIKAQTKGIGHLLTLAEQAIFKKMLPSTLDAHFDYADDAQDRQVAEIKGLRTDRHTGDLTNKTVDERVAREQMLLDGDLTQAQFNTLELAAGRLEDGTQLLQVFYDPQYKALLNMGFPDPMDTDSNDVAMVKLQVKARKADLIRRLGTEKAPRMRHMIRTGMAALDALVTYYMEAVGATSASDNPAVPAPDGQSSDKPVDEMTARPANETVRSEEIGEARRADKV